ncbi:MAG: ABC transporter substrate-binding protein [Acidimicrobiia bacterium]
MLAITGALALTVGAAACGDDGGSSSSGGGEVTLRLGYFPNVTHAPALVGVEEGLFDDSLPDNVNVEVFTFDSGTEVTEALFSDALDISYIGPSPAITAYAQSEGEAVRLISGAASGGASLVTSPDITSPDQLGGTTLATPSLGNTQDVALRAYLADHGFETTTEGGGDVEIVPQENSTTLETFQAGDIDGAWVPEPWATRLVEEGGGEVLVDEASLWPDGQFVTTHIIVRTAYLEDNPDVVKAFLEGHAAAIDFVNDNAEKAQADTINQIEQISGSEVSEDITARAWEQLEFTFDPIASSLQQDAEDAEELGLLDPVDLTDIYDLTLINEILADRGEPEVQGIAVS